MPAIARLTDIGSAHASFPDTDVIEGCGDIDVNSLPAHCVGHAIRPHGSPSPSPEHSRALASGSGNTDFNSRALGHIGSAVDCGGLIVTGSGDSFVN